MSPSSIQYYHKRAVDDILLIIRTLYKQGVLTQDIYDHIMSTSSEIQLDPYTMFISIDGHFVEVENASKEKFKITVKVDPL